MSPAERRTALIRLLARIDQQVAECEELASQPILTDDEEEFVAVHLASGRQARKHAERLLRELDARRQKLLWEAEL